MKRFTYKPQSVYTTAAGKTELQMSLLSKRISVNVQTKAEHAKTKLRFFAMPGNKYNEYKRTVKSSNRQIAVIGQTKLKQVPAAALAYDSFAPKAEAILTVANHNGDTCHFEVRERFLFSRVVGYLPVGDDKFVAVVSFNPLYLLGLFALTLGVILGIVVGFSSKTAPRQEELADNRYIEDAKTSETYSDQGSTRYILNTTLTVVKNTIQNLNFENINEGKYLRLKFKLDYDNDAEYVYDSGLVPSGKKVTADTLLKEVPAGTYRTVAECYSYSAEKEQLAQTNFKITLIVK